jgi:hypothetical protein
MLSGIMLRVAATYVFSRTNYLKIEIVKNDGFAN